MLHHLVTTPEPLLVLVPHPDDELIGCGALLLRRRLARVRTHLLFLTTGEPVEEREQRPRYPARRALRQRCATQVAQRLECSATFLDGPCRRLHHRWNRALARVVDLLDRHAGGILFPKCEAGHPDHDVAWALGQRVVQDMPSRPAWEYSLYGWTDRTVRFLNGLWLVPGDEVLELNSEEALAKEGLLRCYAQEYPRILRRCPVAGETFRRSRPSQGAGQASRPEPGWTCRLSEPVPSDVNQVIGEILA